MHLVIKPLNVFRFKHLVALPDQKSCLFPKESNLLKDNRKSRSRNRNMKQEHQCIVVL